jgi:hypothetical protein
MQTVNFQCGNCGKLMAVAVQFLGQQVRCPHCQQVVVAPAANANAPAPAPAPVPAPAPAPDPMLGLFSSPVPEVTFQSLSSEQADDIFSPRSETDDALFGQAEGPRLELPREESPPFSPIEPRAQAPAPAPDLAPAPDIPLESTIPENPAINPDGFGQTISFPGQDGQTSPSEAATLAPESPIAPWLSGDTGAGVTAGVTEGEALAPTPVRKPRDESGRINWFIPLVFIPLVLYAVLATAAAGFLYLRFQTRPPDLFDRMPDVEGDATGIRYPAGRVLRFKRKDATAKLPAHLRVKLKDTLQIGDLEVTPKMVERKRVGVFARGKKAEPCQGDSLVLTLNLKNTSDEYAFTPLDNFFDRHWDGAGEIAPLTVLVAGPARFFGGPAKWFPRDSKKQHDREWVDLAGRKDFDGTGLAPGASGEYQICTDGDDASVMGRLYGRQRYTGELLWRVHLRRGLVPHKGKQVPATAVIGVEFTLDQVKPDA